MLVAILGLSSLRLELNEKTILEGTWISDKEKTLNSIRQTKAKVSVDDLNFLNDSLGKFKFEIRGNRISIGFEEVFVEEAFRVTKENNHYITIFSYEFLPIGRNSFLLNQRKETTFHFSGNNCIAIELDAGYSEYFCKSIK